MLISYGWRIRAEEHIFGPAPRVEQLYGAVKYMPDWAVWEWKDANGDWHEYISVGRWRENLRKLRWYYNYGKLGDDLYSRGNAPIENECIRRTLWDDYLPVKAERTKKRLQAHARAMADKYYQKRKYPKGWDPWRKRWSPRFLAENPDFEPYDPNEYFRKKYGITKENDNE